MKIGKYTKLKDNRYNVKFDDINIKLYDDVIVKYELLRKKEIDDKLFKEITQFNDSLEAYYKALKYLSRKLRTEKEIYEYLHKEYNRSTCTNTINRLKEEGYLQERQYIKAYITDQVNLASSGPNKIKKELIKLGLNEELITEYLSEIDNEIWLDKINKIVAKAISSNKTYGNNKLKEKLIYDLGNKGYYKWMIEESIAINEFKDNNDIIQKEYQHILSKLSKKYSGYELNSKIISKLLNKGFSYDDIKKVLSDN